MCFVWYEKPKLTVFLQQSLRIYTGVKNLLIIINVALRLEAWGYKYKAHLRGLNFSAHEGGLRSCSRTLLGCRRYIILLQFDPQPLGKTRADDLNYTC
jgi:hypothetical protein